MRKKRILSRLEWFLLIVAIGILVAVILQNRGINLVETVEDVELTEEVQTNTAEKAPLGVKNNGQTGKDRLKSLSDYFAENRRQARAEGKEVGFDWSSLKISTDEKEYLENKYGDKINSSGGTDWMALITRSHQTYKSVKNVLEDIGVNPDKVLNARNVSKTLNNPVVSNAFFDKLEQDFGIPAEKSRNFAQQHRQTLENWADFVEKEINQ